MAGRPVVRSHAMFHVPKVSILIPTYRYARFLPEAIESVLFQDFDDFEILISDDASHDGSAEIIRRYAAMDRRIHAVEQPANLGMVQNWNWCLSLVRGKYVKFLFGDDRFSTGHALRRLCEMLDDNPSAIVASSARRLIDAESRVVGLWNELERDGLHRGTEVGRECLLQSRNLIGEPSAVLFRACDANTLFDTRYRQIVDLEFWLGLLSCGDLVHTTEPLCDFRRHGEQATAANAKLRLGFSEYALLFSEYLERFVPEGAKLTEEEQRYLYSTLHQARKTRGRFLASDFVAEALAPRIAPLKQFRYWLDYRLSRPFVNLRLSLHKRLGKGKLEWDFATGWRHRDEFGAAANQGGRP